MELLIDARTGELVELVDRPGERSGRNTDLLGELFERVRPLQRACRQPCVDVEPTRNLRFDGQEPEGVVVDLTLIEHPMRRNVRHISGGVQPEQLMPGTVVGESLVHEALAGTVHPDAAPYHRVEHGSAVGHHHAGGEPCLVEQRSVGAHRDAGFECVTGVGFAAHRPFVGQRRLVLLAKFTIVFVPAGGEQHASVGEEPDTRTIGDRLDPTTAPPSSTTKRSSAVLVRRVPLPVSRNASNARPINACPPTMTSPGSTPRRSVQIGRRTSGSTSPSSAREMSGGKMVRPFLRQPGTPSK